MFFKITSLTTIFILCASATIFAQSKRTDQQLNDNPSGNVVQPQGNTGPINTKSGGAPASSPQGETSPGMQSAPQGFDKTIKTDKKGNVEGTPKN